MAFEKFTTEAKSKNRKGFVRHDRHLAFVASDRRQFARDGCYECFADSFIQYSKVNMGSGPARIIKHSGRDAAQSASFRRLFRKNCGRGRTAGGHPCFCHVGGPASRTLRTSVLSKRHQQEYVWDGMLCGDSRRKSLSSAAARFIDNNRM